jgi:hypothetical protein
MATGNVMDLILMAKLLMMEPGPMSNVLTAEEADRMEREGTGRVARIPIKRREEGP